MELGGLDVGVNCKYENIFEEREDPQLLSLLNQNYNGSDESKSHLGYLLNDSYTEDDLSSSSIYSEGNVIMTLQMTPQSSSFESSPLSHTGSMMSTEVIGIDAELPMSISSSNVVDEAYFSTRRCRERTFSTSSLTGLCIHPDLVIDRERDTEANACLGDSLPDFNVVQDQILFEDGHKDVQPDDLLNPMDEIIDGEALQQQLINQITSPSFIENEKDASSISAVPVNENELACKAEVKKVLATTGSQVVTIDGVDVRLPTGSIVLAVVNESGSLVPIPASTSTETSPVLEASNASDGALSTLNGGASLPFAAVESSSQQFPLLNGSSTLYSNGNQKKDPDNVPVIEAVDLNTLLEEFEASNNIDETANEPSASNAKSTLKKSPTKLSLKLKKVTTKKLGLSLIERRNLLMKKKLLTNCKITMKESLLPSHVFERIKALNKRRCTKVLSEALIPKAKNKSRVKGKGLKPFNIGMKRKNCQNSNQAITCDEVENVTESTASSLLDHDYCVSPARPLKEKRNLDSLRKVYNKLPDYCQISPPSDTLNRSLLKEEYAYNKKDSGVESGDVSDSSIEVAEKNRNKRDIKGGSEVSSVAASLTVSNDETEDRKLYYKLPDYVLSQSINRPEVVNIKTEPAESVLDQDPLATDEALEEKPKMKKKLKLSEYLMRKKDTGYNDQKNHLKKEKIDTKVHHKNSSDVSQGAEEPEEGEIKEDCENTKINQSIPLSVEESVRTNSIDNEVTIVEPSRDSSPEVNSRNRRHRKDSRRTSKKPNIIEIDLVEDDDDDVEIKAKETKKQQETTQKAAIKANLLATVPLSKMPTTSLGHSLLYSKQHNEKVPGKRDRTRAVERRNRRSSTSSRSRSASRGSNSNHARRRSRGRRKHSLSGHRKRHRRSRAKTFSKSRSRGRSFKYSYESYSSDSSRSRSRSHSKSSYSTYSRSRSKSRSSRSRRERYSKSSERSRYRTRPTTHRRERENWLNGYRSSRQNWSSYPPEASQYRTFCRRQDEMERDIEERRVIYIGALPDGITKAELRARFEKFGPILDINIYFRERRDNYGFVTFGRAADAYQAMEHGNDDPDLPSFNICFGGRRSFCRVQYADLDAQNEDYECGNGPSSMDYDSLLRMALDMRR